VRNKQIAKLLQDNAIKLPGTGEKWMTIFKEYKKSNLEFT
jgi:hypothetical protein